MTKPLRRLGKRNKDMICGTWNIQGLRTKEAEIALELEQKKVEIAVLTETKKKGTGTEYIGNYLHIFSGVPKHERASKGVSLLISRKIITNLHHWETINERLITANLNINGHRTTVIGAYGPNEDAPQKIKEQFYNQLNNLLTVQGKQREIIIMGDLNARTGSRIDGKVVGRYGEKTENDNGKRLIQICEQHSLKILNGFYQHKNIHKYTWHQTSRDLRTIIDYVIVKQNTEWKTEDIRVCRGPNCGSDHYFLQAKIKIKHKKYTKPTEIIDCQTIQLPEYNIDGLRDYSTRNLYRNRLDQKLNEISILEPTEILYKQITEALHSAAFEALGQKIKQKPNSGITWTRQMEGQRVKKQNAYKKWLTTKNDTDRMNYRREQAIYKKIINENKNETWEAKCTEIDTYMGGARSAAAWRFIKTLRSGTTNRTSITPITIETFEKHYKNELTEDREQYKSKTERLIEIAGEPADIAEEVMSKAIRSMKNGKASGSEGIPAELVKNGTTKLSEYLQALFKRFLNGEELPEAWKEAWITPIHKKGRKDECKNYRCITVTNTLSRLYGKVIKQLIEREYEESEIEQQAGFRAGRSCVDHIFTLTQLNEKKVATDRELHLLFVDLTKAYDTVPLNKLWEVLEATRINATVVKAIQRLYHQTKARIKIGKRISNTFEVTKGLRQGCCLSPTLFNMYLNRTLEDWRKSCQKMGVQLNDDTTLYTLHFADDQVVIAQDQFDLEFMARKMLREYDKWGLSVNKEKTQYLCVGKNNLTDLQVSDNIIIKSCQEYKYLGTTITNNGRTETEIENRIKQGKKVIGCLNPILWNRAISNDKKRMLFDTILKTIVLYGSEAWQLSRRTEQQLLVLEMDFWRRSAGKSKMERINNERIREMMNVETDIIHEVTRKQLEWYGHVERMDDHRIPKLAKEWIPTERKKRGRPKPTWMGGIVKMMSERNLRPGDWLDRSGWRDGTRRRRTL